MHGILIDYQQLVHDYGNHQENYRRTFPEGGEDSTGTATCTRAFNAASQVGG